MRISDWSSDVCSSDLGGSGFRWRSRAGTGRGRACPSADRFCAVGGRRASVVGQDFFAAGFEVFFAVVPVRFFGVAFFAAGFAAFFAGADFAAVFVAAGLRLRPVAALPRVRALAARVFFSMSSASPTSSDRIPAGLAVGSEEDTSETPALMRIPYYGFWLKTKKHQ